MTARAFAASLLVAFAALGAGADTLQYGDVMTGIQLIAIMCPTPPSIMVLSSQFQPKSGPYSGGMVAIDAIGRSYVLENDLGPWDADVMATQLDLFDTSFTKIHTITLPEPARAIAVDAAGSAYVVSASGTTRVFSPAGTQLRTFALPDVAAAPAPISLDISSDYCTLAYLGSGGVAHRFDVCTQTALPAIGPHFDSVRALADGGIVGTADGRIRIYDRSGSTVADRAAPTQDPITALAFGIGGGSLWVGSRGQLFEVRLSDGTVVAHLSLFASSVRSIAVFGERRPTAASETPSRRRASRH